MTPAQAEVLRKIRAQYPGALVQAHQKGYGLLVELVLELPTRTRSGGIWLVKDDGAIYADRRLR